MKWTVLNHCVVVHAAVTSLGLLDEVLAQEHAPFGHDQGHNHVNCHGYAMGRAFGWQNTSACDINTMEHGEIDEVYFTCETLSGYSSIETDDIVNWGSDHSSYVTDASGSSNPSYIQVAQADGTFDEVQDPSGLTLQHVINGGSYGGYQIIGRGTPSRRCYQKFYEATFSNSFSGYGSSGTVTVDGSSKASGDVTNVIPRESVTAEAVDQRIDGVLFQFDQWTDNNTGHNTTNRTIELTPTQDVNYTAHFTGVPDPVNGFQYVGAVGEPIQFQWSEHPSPYVEYVIYRYVKNVSDWSEIDRVSHGTTSYTDPLYSRTASYTDDLLAYKVYSYFTPDATMSTFAAGGYGIYGEIYFKNPPKRSTLPTTPSLNVFPNPSRDQTTIEYMLAEEGAVHLGIYDLTGRHVRTLVDQAQGVGVQAAVWDGRMANGNAAASGAYLVRLEGASGSVVTASVMLVR